MKPLKRFKIFLKSTKQSLKRPNKKLKVLLSFFSQIFSYQKDNKLKKEPTKREEKEKVKENTNCRQRNNHQLQDVKLS